MITDSPHNTSAFAATSRKRHLSGFTLMELLVVVAILAIVAGLVTVAYDGLVGQAAKGAATNAIGSLSNSISIYKVTEHKLPSNLDTLIAATPNNVVWTPALADNVSDAYTPGGTLIGALNAQLRSKLTVRPLTATEKTNLIAAGITQLRYLDVAGNANLAQVQLNIPSVGGAVARASVGPAALVDIPSHLFDVPMDSDSIPAANRGRGYSVDLTRLPTASVPDVAVLIPGTGNYEYIKLGASPTSALIVLGVGKNSSIVQAGGNASGTATKARLANAPFYGDVGKAEYPNYLAVIDVSQSPAQFITVLDPTGHSLAEDYAAGRGQ